MALTTVANVKAWLEISSSNSDSVLQRLIDSCSTLIVSYLNRNVELSDYSEQYDGNGSTYLTLRQYPITQVASVAINGAAQSLITNTEFNKPGIRFEGRRIIINGGNFPRGNANISVSYSAGFAEVPPDLEQACIEFVAMRWKNGRGERVGVSGKSLAGESISFFTGDIPPFVKTALQQYKNVVPV